MIVLSAFAKRIVSAFENPYLEEDVFFTVETKTVIPKRVHALEAAQANTPDLVERLLPELWNCDPIADDIVKALHTPDSNITQAVLDEFISRGTCPLDPIPLSIMRLKEEIDTLPDWVDWSRIERGGQLLIRSGFFGGLVLGAKSLVHGYCAPAGNKPLAFSGRLKSRAPRRLSETMRFVQAVAAPGGMGRWGDGLAITLRVRLMHAQVRYLIHQTGRWESALWGEPINQHDMLATTLLFSSVFLDGLRRFGLHISTQEAEDSMHLWCYVGHVMGVKSNLLPKDEADAVRLQQFIYDTQGPPDKDSRELVRALLDLSRHTSPPDTPAHTIQRRIQFAEGICRGLLGEELADSLELPDHRWKHIVPILNKLIQPFELLRVRHPILHTLSHKAGQRYWEQAVNVGLAQKPATFARPEKLAPPTT